MKKILAIVMSLFLALGVSACSEKETTAPPPPEEENGGSNNGDNNDDTPSEDNTPTSGDILIVYFSRAGENYNVGTVSVGNTAMLAGYIQEVAGGVLFEITPEVPYPTGYEETKLISQRERDEDLRPAIKNRLDSLEKYSIVFIGSPIWYGGPPMIMQTFYEAYPQLANKTLVPFGTHEGSGIGSCITLLRRYFPQTDIKESFGLRGAEVRNLPAESRNAVRGWINRLGISK